MQETEEAEDMRGKKHPDEIRAAVVGAFSAGMEVADIARLYNLDKSVVSRWRPPKDDSKLQQVATEKEADFRRMATDVAISIMRHLKTVADETCKPEYIRSQTAADVAILADTLFNQCARIFESSEDEGEIGPENKSAV